MPDVRIEASSPTGMGQVVLDVQGEPAQAVEITGHYQQVLNQRTGATSTPIEITNGLCVTPCTVALGLGSHQLRFTSLRDAERTSTGTVVVSPDASVYRHSLGLDRSRLGVQILSAIAIALGTTFVLGGVAIGAQRDRGDGLSTNGLGLGFGLGGLALGALGVLGVIHFRSESQPGSGTQFLPPNASSTPWLSPPGANALNTP